MVHAVDEFQARKGGRAVSRGHAGSSADRLHKTRRLGRNQRSAPQHRPSSPGNGYPGDTQIEAGRPHEAGVAAVSTTVYAAIVDLDPRFQPIDLADVGIGAQGIDVAQPRGRAIVVVGDPKREGNPGEAAHRTLRDPGNRRYR